MNEELKKELLEYIDKNAKYSNNSYWKYIEEIKLLLQNNILEDGRKLTKKNIHKYLVEKYEHEAFGKYENFIAFVNRNLTAERYIVKKKVVNKKLDANNKKVVKEASVDSLSKENSETQKTIARMMEVVRARNS